MSATESNQYPYRGLYAADLFDLYLNNKTNTMCQEHSLMLCDSCFWCASSLVEFKHSKICHYCKEGVINVMPISSAYCELAEDITIPFSLNEDF